MNEKSFTIMKDGKSIKCNVLFFFTKNKENYIVYTDNTNEIFGSKYIIKDNNLILEPIEDNSIWDIIDKKLGEYYG